MTRGANFAALPIDGPHGRGGGFGGDGRPPKGEAGVQSLARDRRDRTGIVLSKH
jgi:hypothetical protein